jgi:hypothetical protein
MSIALLIEEIKTLPENRVAEVRDFVEFVKQKDTESAADQESDTSWFEKGEGCPICAKHRDPVTGEPRFNAETIAAFEEGDAMLRGDIPVKWYNSLDEMMADLDSDDDD